MGRQGASAWLESLRDCAERSAAVARCGTNITKSCRDAKFRRFILRQRELVFRATWKLFPGPTAFKVPFAAADVLVLLLLAWMFRKGEDRDFRVAVYAWNPLVIVEFAGSGHNDVLAMLGIVCGLALVKKWPSMASVPIAFAAMAKVFPALLFRCGSAKQDGRERKRAGGRRAWRRWRRLCCLRRTGMRWECFDANMAYYEATWKNYHASLYTVIDWLTGGKTRIPAIRRRRRLLGDWHFGWRGNTRSRRAPRIC